MIYKCKNCDGNMVFQVEEQKMLCPFCNSYNTEYEKPGQNMRICECCGAEVFVSTYASAGKCPACSQYLIFDERVSGTFKPNRIMPFKIGKNVAKTLIRREFEKKFYIPDDFLSEARLTKIEGTYVPFWLFNIDSKVLYRGVGSKVRRWTSGNTQYTETSYYEITRDFDAAYKLMPVDASLDMPDATMDLMEPYEYKYLEGFDPKYMSGFLGEIYSAESNAFESRASEKARKDSEGLLNNSIRGYNHVTIQQKQIFNTCKENEYVLLPVWRYTYEYHSEKYECYVNGQTGKVLGSAPLSKAKMIAYPLTVFLMLLAGFSMLFTMGWGFIV